MSQKRPDDIRPYDVSQRDSERTDKTSLSRKKKPALRRVAASRLVRLGGMISYCFLRVVLAIVRCIEVLLWRIVHLPRALVPVLRSVGRFLLQPVRLQMRHADRIQQNIRNAKGKGRAAMAEAAFSSVLGYLGGENGLFVTLFNYAAPIVSIAFLVGVVRYGVGLDYGLRVEYNGELLGVVSSEEEVNSATREVRRRIANVDGVDAALQTPRLSLTIVESGVPYITTTSLADKILTSADVPLVEAFGVYIDDELCAAVEDKTAVENALLDNLAAFVAQDNATDIRYENEVTFQKGLFLEESLTDTETLCKKLTAADTYNGQHTVSAGDTPLSVAKRYSMTLEELVTLNPILEEEDVLTPGERLTVEKENRFLPIAYTLELTLTSFIDYETIELETSAVNKGDKKVISPGSRGEKQNVVDVVYVNGAEAERKVKSSVVLKEPVDEQVGIGTYTAAPVSASTVLQGNGQFSWPVNGGYISDPFISNRNHKGLDIAAPSGTDIYAAADGVVTVAGWNSGGYGYLVMIDHGNGYTTVYGHCSTIWAAVGQTVRRGQNIAAVGSTGNSTGNHLHFEVRYNGICSDPAAYLKVN